MIAKHVPMRSIKKSDFTGLVKYILNAQEKNERVGEVRVSNCHQPDVFDAVLEIEATQSLNKRSGADKTYHLVVAFPPGEQPNKEVLDVVEKRLCDALGYGDHQRVSAVHHDTDSLHLHVAINKVHPGKFTVHTPFNDYKSLGRECERLEEEFGLTLVNHQSQKRVSEGRAKDMESHSGQESLLGWIRNHCLESCLSAASWKELHESLSQSGLKLCQRGNGLIFLDAESGLAVKASSVSRELSKSSWESRLGTFDVSDDVMQKPVQQKYQSLPKGFSINTSDLFAAYKQYNSAMYEYRKIKLAEISENQRQSIAYYKRTAKLKRHLIKQFVGDRWAKRILYRQASNRLWKHIQKTNERMRDGRVGVYQNMPKLTWADWLRKEALAGNGEALRALRSRERKNLVQGNTLGSVHVLQPGPASKHRDSITKKGTQILTFGRTVVRDSGQNIHISRGEQDRAGLLQTLIMAKQRFGTHLTVKGSPEFKARIIHLAATRNVDVVFDDVLLERKKQAMINHHREIQNAGRIGRRSVDRGSVSHAGRNGGRGEYLRLVPTGPSKSNVEAVGSKPPPQSQNRLRELSKLGVVQFADGGEVLLSSHVPGRVEQPGAQRDSGVRRSLSGIDSSAWGAAQEYVNEREDKRALGIELPEHRLFDETYAGKLHWSGVRNVGESKLGLVRAEDIDIIFVLPITDKNARSLKTARIGQDVSITQQGSINVKGRSR